MFEQDNVTLRARDQRIMFGAAYYPEYQPSPRGESDFALMKAAGFSVIRVGESVWSTWEPSDGVFDLDWLETTLDLAEAHGIGVILGTPTYAIPMWLKERHPDIVADIGTGKPMQWGSRQEMDFTHHAYLFHAERIIRKMVERYRDHPAVIGFQVDNEPGIRLLYNETVFQRFVRELESTYGTVERLNDEWGLVYWSHRLSTWADLWRPDGNAQPQYDIAWRRFQAGLVTEFITWQASIVRELARRGQFTTTCISYEQAGVEDVDLAFELDIASGNAYYEMQDSFSHPSNVTASTGKNRWIVRGPWAVSQLADLMYSSKQSAFYVTETNASSIGSSSSNQSPYDGQWRQAAWLLVSRGARMVEYWQWNTLTFGAETYWGGVLPHSGIPGRAYSEIAQLGGEFRMAGDAFSEATPEFDVAVLYDSESKWALEAQPPFRTLERDSDPDSYRRLVAAFSRGIFDAKLQERIVRPQQFFPGRGGELTAASAAARYPILIMGGFYTASDDDLDFLVSYAEAGGHLVLGPKSGYADREARARDSVQPARLTTAAGVFYEEFANLDAPLAISASVEFGDEAAATSWIDGLKVTDATVLARYKHPHFGKWAAATTRPTGPGRITVIGTVPDQTFSKALASWLAPRAVSGWSLTEPSVTVTTSRTPDNARLHVLHNWSWTPCAITAPTELVDVLSQASLAVGDSISLGAWDVRVFRSLV